MHSHLHNLILFNTWANHRVVESLKSCPVIPEMGVIFLSHILQNNWYVLDLIKGLPGTPWYAAVDYSLAECIAEIPKIESAYLEYVSSKSEAELAQTFEFTGYEGSHRVRVISDMLFHTMDHCTYHRGQIAMVVRQAGGEPAKTWYGRWTGEVKHGDTK